MNDGVMTATIAGPGNEPAFVVALYVLVLAIAIWALRDAERDRDEMSNDTGHAGVQQVG